MNAVVLLLTIFLKTGAPAVEATVTGSEAACLSQGPGRAADLEMNPAVALVRWGCFKAQGPGDEAAPPASPDANSAAPASSPAPGTAAA